MEKDILTYDSYLKDEGTSKKSETRDYPTPETGVIPATGDKIIAYMKSQFIAQIPYFNVGIRSNNPDLPEYKNNGTK